MYTECQNCAVQWGTIETETQTCDSCGWQPEIDPEDEDNWGHEFDDDLYD